MLFGLSLHLFLMSEDEVNLVELYKNEKSELQQPQLIQEQQELTEEQVDGMPCGTFRVTRPPKICFDGKFYSQEHIVDLLIKARNETARQKQSINGLLASYNLINQQLTTMQQQLNRTNQKLQGVEKQLRLTETDNSSLQDTICVLEELLQQK